MQKTVIVTGGCRGIGLAISKRFCKEGYLVIPVGRKDPELCSEPLSEIESLGMKPYYIQADLSISEHRQRVVETVVARFGRIDCLVNNAGVAPKDRTSILNMTEESWDYVMDSNTKANMFMTQLVARAMIKQEPIDSKRGTIINISSCSAEVSSPNRAQYCVSKAGISMLTEVYADALSQYGILVNEVRPGVIRSDMTATVKEKYDNLIEQGTFPIARWGEGSDVASAVFALSGNDFLYTTGSYIDVDGGFHIKRL